MPAEGHRCVAMLPDALNQNRIAISPTIIR